MGSGASTQNMVIHRLADATAFEEKDLKLLAEKFKSIAEQSGNPNTIVLSQLPEALEAVGIVEKDKTLLAKVFSLMDASGDGQVFFKDFIVCCSSMISKDLKENLRFSFEMYAEQSGGVTVSKNDMTEVLLLSNKSASWFGDPALSRTEIDQLVDEVFENHADKSVDPPALHFKQYMESVVEHPILVQFITGKGTIRRSPSIKPPDTEEETAGPIEALTAAATEALKINPGNLCAKNLLESDVQDWMQELEDSQIAQLALCAKSGLDNPDSGLGCYAVDPKNYDEFAMFFDKVCEDYHKGGGKMHENNWSLEGVEGLPEDGQLDLQKFGLSEPLSMRVRVGRNLTTFPLPGLMTKADRISFEKTMLAAFEVLKADPTYGGNVFSMTPSDDWKEVTGEEANPNLITQEKYQELVDAHVMFKDMAADPYLASAGIASDWPCGRGCYQSEDGGFIIWFGEEDQLRIMCMAKGFMLNDVFDRLQTALAVVEAIDGIEFAKSEKYGYVTSCPSNLGTGMRASVHVKVPNLTADGTDTQAKAAAKPLGLSVRGTGGEHTPIGKDGTIDLSPSNRLFITEAQIITKLYNGIKLLLEKEAAAAPEGTAAAAAAQEAA